MGNIDHCYAVEEVSAEQALTYFFESKGLNQMSGVIKVIQYSYVQHFDRIPVFNLGFGDLNIKTGKIDDVALTGNGDVYRVFNTVLNTVPQFYERYPNCIILVQGSDGCKTFEAVCRITCKRKCGSHCHKQHRRMKTYCNFITRNYSTLKPDFKFLGGKRNLDGWFDFGAFIPGNLYDAIMVSKKNVNL